MEFDRPEGEFRLAVALLEEASHFREFLRRRALERENRLLLVADREDGPDSPPRARSGEKLGRESRHDGPLLGRSVLRFVDEQVVERVIELVHDPGGARTRDEFQRARCLVGEIEDAALGLGLGESGERSPRDPKQRLAALERAGGAPLVAQRFEARLLALEVGFEIRAPFELLRRDAAASTARLADARCSVLLLEERIEQRFDARLGIARCIDGSQPVCEIPIRAASFVEPLRPGLPALSPDVAAEHFGFDPRGRVVRREAEGVPQGRAVSARVPERLERLGETLRFGEHRRKAEGARLARRQFERARLRRLKRNAIDGACPRLRHERLRLALVDHLEMRGNVGLEGEELQEPFAEGVQRLHAQAPRRFDRAGEEPPRILKGLRIGRVRAGFLDRSGERLVVERRPFGERPEYAGRHIGGGGLGEGEAEDARWGRPGKQQPQHALGEHIGLAAAGVGRHPGGGAGRGGRRLRLAQLLGNGQRAIHAVSPSMSSPEFDHSFTRARWS